MASIPGPAQDLAHSCRRSAPSARILASRRPRLVLAGLVLSLVSARGAMAAGPDAEGAGSDGPATSIELSVSPSESADGVYQLSWTASGPVRIEESTQADFASVRVVYAGRDRATTLTGRRDGRYHYRARALASSGALAVGGAISAPVSVQVSHHPLSRALLFFGVGGFVFVATVGLIVVGDRRLAQERCDDRG